MLYDGTVLSVCTVMVEQDTAVDEKLKELSRAVELFKDRLGLSFKKTSGTVLQMFTVFDYRNLRPIRRRSA